MPTVQGTDDFNHGNFTVPGGASYTAINGSPAKDTSIVHSSDPASLLISATAATEYVEQAISGTPRYPWHGYWWRMETADEPASGNISVMALRATDANHGRLEWQTSSNKFYHYIVGGSVFPLSAVITLDAWHWIEHILDTDGGGTRTMYTRIDGVDLTPTTRVVAASTGQGVTLGFPSSATMTCRYSNHKWGTAASISDWLGEPTDSYSSAVLADSPLAYWRLDTAAGTESDLGSGGHTLTYVSAIDRAQAGLLSSTGDTCARFSADAEYCSTPTTSDLTFLTPFSVECWVRYESLVDAGITSYGLVAKGSAGNGGWAFYLRLGFFALTLYGVADIISSFAPVVDTTYHLAVVWRGSGNTDFYVNNVKQNVTTAGSPITNSQATVIAQTSDLGANTIRGYMDEVALYGTALSDARVAAHYSAGFPEPGYQRIAGPTQLSASAATLFTVPTGMKAELRSVDLNNPSGSSVDVTLQTVETTQVTVSIAASGDDSRLRRTGATYPPTGGVVALATGTDLEVFKDWSGSQYDVRLQFLRFDTSVIPDNATVTGATLQIERGGGSNTDTRNLNFEWWPGTDWASAAVIDTDDWSDSVGTDACVVALSTVISGSTIDNFTLTSAAANISKTGYTGIRIGISGSTPTSLNEFWGKSFDHVTLQEPRLIVDYIVPFYSDNIPAGGSLNLRRGINHTLVAGEVLQAYADSASVVVATIDANVEEL